MLLDEVRAMLDETPFAVPIDPSLSGLHHQHHRASSSDSTKLRQLAIAVVKLWAATFNKETPIFEIIRVMGAGLEGYADGLQRPGDRTPLAMGRMGGGGGGVLG